MSDITNQKEQINKVTNDIENLNQNVSNNINMNGEFAEYYKKRLDEVSSDVKEVNDMMNAVSEVESKTKRLLILKEEIENNIAKIENLSRQMESLEDDINNKEKMAQIQMQINLLNDQNKIKNDEYEFLIKSIENIISQY